MSLNRVIWILHCLAGLLVFSRLVTYVQITYGAAMIPFLILISIAFGSAISRLKIYPMIFVNFLSVLIFMLIFAVSEDGLHIMLDLFDWPTLALTAMCVSYALIVRVSHIYFIERNFQIFRSKAVKTEADED